MSELDDISKAFADLAGSMTDLTDALKESLESLVNSLPKKTVIVKGADVKPDVYGGYLQKKRRRKKN